MLYAFRLSCLLWCRKIQCYQDLCVQEDWGGTVTGNVYQVYFSVPQSELQEEFLFSGNKTIYASD